MLMNVSFIVSDANMRLNNSDTPAIKKALNWKQQQILASFSNVCFLCYLLQTEIYTQCTLRTH